MSYVDIEKMSKMISTLQRNLQLSSQRMANMSMKIKKLEEENKKNKYYREILQSIFNNDQIRALEIKKYGGKKVKEWSNLTIKFALQIKFACGNSGYEELRRRGYPLPAVRTLREKLQDLNFEPGINHEIFVRLV